MIRRFWRWLVKPRPVDWPRWAPDTAPAGMVRVDHSTGRCSCCALWVRYCICGWPFCKGSHR